MTPLCDLARKHGTDKGGEHFKAGQVCHYYTTAYWELLKDRILCTKRVLEIGVNTGASLFMWEEFFPSAYIDGIDISPICVFSEGRISCMQADQGNPASLRAAVGDRLYDLIVDDGSHRVSDQITSMQTLLPSLAPGGYYVIEDLSVVPPLLEAIPEGYLPNIFYVEPSLGPSPFLSQLMVIRRADRESSYRVLPGVPS